MNLTNLPSYSDYRGKIQMVNESIQVGSLSIIESNPGAVRADHFHPRDEHTILIREGQIYYYERPLNSDKKPVLIILNKGDLFHTYKNMEHCMFSPGFSVFDCYSLLARDSATYEQETIKLPHSLKILYDNWKE